MTDWEQRLFDGLLAGGFVSAALVFVGLFFLTAPYGRHTRKGWGPTLPTVLGWVLMELPAAVLLPVWFFIGSGFSPSPAWIFLVIWETHYAYRAFLFPFRLRGKKKSMPVLIVVFGMLFNLFNTYINGRYLGAHAAHYPVAWLQDPRFLTGLLFFIAGYAINHHADRVLFRLRKPGERDYKIPHGGLYRWVSCPNYLGELLEWTGWAIATWSLPGLLFAVWTFANLVPRAHSHHRWYRENFEDYPAQRKAIFPFVF
jgi:3-oxo-5-alpha-steroid 4-dehydrogenase 1